MNTTPLSFNPVDNERLARLCGPLDENLKQIETGLDVLIQRRGEHFKCSGEQADLAVYSLTRLYLLAEKQDISIDDVQLELVEARQHNHEADADAPVLLTRRGDLRGRTRARAVTSRPSASTTSPSASARPVPAKPIWPWPARWMPWNAMPSSASCWCARRWKPVKNWAFCPAIWHKSRPLPAPALRRPVRPDGF
jgi:hypothetical protein